MTCKNEKMRGMDVETILFSNPSMRNFSFRAAKSRVRTVRVLEVGEMHRDTATL